MKRAAVAVSMVLGAALGYLWTIASRQPVNSLFWHSRWPRWVAYSTCPFIDLGQKGLASTLLIPLLNAAIYGSFVYLILRFAKRPVIPAATILGGAVGVFWMIAVDAGVNGANWPPRWPNWAVYTTCPFVRLIGLSGFANGLVPLLNGLLYGLFVYAVLGSVRRSGAPGSRPRRSDANL